MRLQLQRRGVVLSLSDGSIFNCGSAEFEGNEYLFPRIPRAGYSKRDSGGGFANYVSDIWFARKEKNGIFSLTTEPLIRATEPYERAGCEDARVSEIDGEFFMTYTVCSPGDTNGWVKARIGLASTKDFVHAQKYGIVGPDINDKDAVLFPGYVDGKVAMLHRVEPSIQIAWFDSLEALKENKPSGTNWGAYLVALRSYIVMSPKFWWEARKVGAGAPPILTKYGWLLIYHGVDKNFVYRAGAAILDRNDPRKVIARCPHPILEPRARYEREGDVPRVVFPCGALERRNSANRNILSVFYGGGDSVCALAECDMKEFLHYLMRFA